MNRKLELPQSFLMELKELESAYLRYNDPIRQSGFHGGEERWKRERGLILDAVDGDGDFLDIGCANGYLVECLVEWARERGIALNPYGVDQGAQLIELARRRLPHYAPQFWVGNAWDWIPPQKFRYVYTLIYFVPEEFLKDYLTLLLQDYVEDEGFLIIGAYGSTSRREPARNVAAMLSDFGFPLIGEAACGDLPVSHIAWTKL